MTEQWRPVPQFEGLYEVSDRGRVRSLARRVNGLGGTQKIHRAGVDLKPAVNTSGYEFVVLNDAPRRVNRYIHRLVLTAFRGEAPGMFACHQDGDKRHNHLANLRWDTPSANALDAVRHGQHPETRKTHCPQGHPYDADNTGTRRSGHRWCRACNRAGLSARYAKTKGESS